MTVNRRTWTREKTGAGSPYLQKILELYEEGLTSVEIAAQVGGKDHTTVLYHLRRMGIPTGIKRTRGIRTRAIIILPPEALQPPIIRTSKYDYLFEEDINPGKEYREYLEDAGKTPAQIRKILIEKAKAAALSGSLVNETIHSSNHTKAS